MQNSEFNKHALLSAALSAASPIWAARIRGYDDATCRRRAYAAGCIIGCYSDRIMLQERSSGKTFAGRDLIGLWLRSEKNGHGDCGDPFKPSPSSGELFNVLSESIAILNRATGVGIGEILERLFDDSDS